jgi:hypothetical protein
VDDCFGYNHADDLGGTDLLGDGRSDHLKLGSIFLNLSYKNNHFFFISIFTTES